MEEPILSRRDRLAALTQELADLHTVSDWLHGHLDTISGMPEHLDQGAERAIKLAISSVADEMAQVTAEMLRA